MQDLLELVSDEETRTGPPQPLQFDPSYATTLLDTPNVEAVLPRTTSSEVGHSTPITYAQTRPEWRVSQVKKSQVTSSIPQTTNGPEPPDL